MPFHIDYRPEMLEDVVGNDSVVEALLNLLGDDDRPHAYAFYGPSGCGKTTLARIMAKALDGRGQDIMEINAAETRGIDTIRDISRRLYYRPVEGAIRACILDEAHQLTGAASNALLKTLEDCPPHTYFFLCSTEPDKLLTTVKNRCSTYMVTKLNKVNMTELVDIIIDNENINLSDEDKSILIKKANGVPRTALLMLDQIKNVKGEIDFEHLIVEDVIDVTVPDICQILLKETDGKKAWDKLRKNVKVALQSTESERIRHGIVSYLGKILQDSDITYAGFVGSLIGCFLDPAYDEAVLWMQLVNASGGLEEK